MSERERVSVQLKYRFRPNSEAGRTFAWVREYFDETTEEMIACAMKVLFYPMALADAGETEEVVRTAIKKSRYIFDERMRLALEPYLDYEEISDSGSAPIQPKSAKQIPRISTRDANVVRFTEPKQPKPVPEALDEDDVFFIDESKIFDDTNHFGGIQ